MGYTNLPDGVLIKLLEEIRERIDNGDGDMEEPFSEYNSEMLEEVCRYFGIELNDFTDRSFFIQLYEENPNFETEPIKRPKLSVYDVVHAESVREYKTNYYNTRVDSYYPLNKDIIYDLQSQGEYSYWEGSHFDTDYHDSDVTEDEVVEIKRKKI
jgi:hypothetical protein